MVPLSPCHPVGLQIVSNGDVLKDKDIRNVCNYDPNFLQSHPLIMHSNSNAHTCAFEWVDPVEAIPDDIVEGHWVVREG